MAAFVVNPRALPGARVLKVQLSLRISMGYTRHPVRARVISHNHGLAYSIGGAFAELLRFLGVGDRAVVHVADMERPVSFRARARVFGSRYYIHIPKWAMPYYRRGMEVNLLITPLPQEVGDTRP